MVSDQRRKTDVIASIDTDITTDIGIIVKDQVATKTRDIAANAFEQTAKIDHTEEAATAIVGDMTREARLDIANDTGHIEGATVDQRHREAARQGGTTEDHIQARGGLLLSRDRLISGKGMIAGRDEIPMTENSVSQL